MNLSDDTRRRMTGLIGITLPLLGVLYFVVDLIWEVPNLTFSLAFILALIFVFGIILNITDKSDIYDGTMIVKEDPEGNRKFIMDLTHDPDDFVERKSISFRVVRSYLKESLIPEDQAG